MVASAFSSGYQNDAPTRWFLITGVVVIVVVVAVVVVVVVVVPFAASCSCGNFHNGPIRRSVAIVAPTSPPDQFDRSEFDALTLLFAVFTTFCITAVVVVVVVVVDIVVPPAASRSRGNFHIFRYRSRLDVIVIIVVVVVVVVVPPIPRSCGNFHIKIPHRSRLESPRCRKYQWLPWRPVGSSLATVAQLQNEDGVR
jgi:hypothetical protein